MQGLLKADSDLWQAKNNLNRWPRKFPLASRYTTKTITIVYATKDLLGTGLLSVQLKDSLKSFTCKSSLSGVKYTYGSLEFYDFKHSIFSSA